MGGFSIRIAASALFGFAAGVLTTYLCQPLFWWVHLAIRSKGFSEIEASFWTQLLVFLGVGGFTALGIAFGMLWAMNVHIVKGHSVYSLRHKVLLVIAVLSVVGVLLLLGMRPPSVSGY